MIEIRQDIMQVNATFTGEEFVVNVVIGSNGTVVDSDLSLTSTNPVQNAIVTAALATKMPIPSEPTTTTPSHTDTLPIYKQATEESPAGWFKFTWAKLVEWLGTHFSPFRIAAPVASFAPVAAEDTLQDLAGKLLGVWDAINTPPKSYEIAYNPDGSVSQISYEGGDVITYFYSQGQVSSWSDGNRTWTVVKDIDGNIININIS